MKKNIINTISDMMPRNTCAYGGRDFDNIWALIPDTPLSHSTSASRLPSANTLREFSAMGSIPRL